MQNEKEYTHYSQLVYNSYKFILFYYYYSQQCLNYLTMVKAYLNFI